MTVLLCPVRPGDKNEELRYAVRSWETNLITPLTLVTIGYCPTWLKPDAHVSGNFYESTQLAVFDNVLRGVSYVCDMSTDEPVLVMNDDFFCMDPMSGVVPVKRNQTLAAQIEQFSSTNSLWWARSLALTASWLASEGYPHPDSYEAHRPLLVQPQAMRDSLLRWVNSSSDSMKGDVPQWRTIYGVLNEVEAYPVKDAKLGLNSTGIGTPWLSTSDQSWRRYARPLSQRFQKPSRWELT